MPQQSKSDNRHDEAKPTIRTFGMTFNAERLAIGRLIKEGKLPKLSGWVYVSMIAHVNRRTGQLSVSHELIAEEAGVAVRTVGTCARALTKESFFSVTSKRNAAGHSYNIYTPLNIVTGTPLYVSDEAANGSRARRKSYGKRRQSQRQKSANPKAKDSTSQRHTLPDNHTSSPIGREDVREPETAIASRPSDEGGRDAVGAPEINDDLLRDVWEGLALSVRMLRAKAIPVCSISRRDLYGDLARQHKIDVATARAVVAELVRRGRCEVTETGRGFNVRVIGFSRPYDQAPSSPHQSEAAPGTPAQESARLESNVTGTPNPEKKSEPSDSGIDVDQNCFHLSAVEVRARALEQARDKIADATQLRRLETGINKIRGTQSGTRKWELLVDFWDDLFEKQTGTPVRRALAALHNGTSLPETEVDHALGT